MFDFDPTVVSIYNVCADVSIDHSPWLVSSWYGKISISFLNQALNCFYGKFLVSIIASQIIDHRL